MNKEQALNMLKFISDLYAIIQEPMPVPEEELDVSSNGWNSVEQLNPVE